MDCKKIDFLEYYEGAPREEVILHIRNCRKCQRESEKMKRFSKLLSGRYSAGKKLEKELDEHLRSIDLTQMVNLPEGLQKRVAGIKQKNLFSRVKKVLGKNKKSEGSIIGGLLAPRFQALPASPRDITKTKNYKRKKNK